MTRLSPCFVLLMLSLVLSPVVLAEPNTAASVYDDSGNYGDSQGYGRGRNLGYPGVLADILLLRPVGVVLAAAGTALFVATTPLVAIADIAPPHDAFARAGTIMVLGPAGFAFNRPLGEMTYQRDGVYPNLTRPQDRKFSAPVPVVTETTVTPLPPAKAAPKKQ
ncbi:MAG: hypothetical protein RLZ25_2347 [Pseudomonadota bacterium]|jgi:hypothetical protein